MAPLLFRFAALVLLCHGVVGAALPVLKVLPLGDSITFGCGSDAAPPDWFGPDCRLFFFTHVVLSLLPFAAPPFHVFSFFLSFFLSFFFFCKKKGMRAACRAAAGTARRCGRR
jgi:hypothetical protein